MNKFLLKLSLLASIATVSVTNGAESSISVTTESVTTEAKPSISATTEAKPSSATGFGSPLDKKNLRKRHMSAAPYVIDEDTTVRDKSTTPLPVNFRIACLGGENPREVMTELSPQDKITTLKDFIIEYFQISADFQLMVHVPTDNTNSEGNMLTVKDVFFQNPKVIKVTVIEAKRPSPNQSNPETPAPQSGKISLDAADNKVETDLSNSSKQNNPETPAPQSGKISLDAADNNVETDLSNSSKQSNPETPAPQSGKISLDASISANPEKAE